jgi:hypothetical protein
MMSRMRRLACRCALAAMCLVLVAADPKPGGKPLTPDDLMGKWCGDVSDYVFTRDKLTVQMHAGGTRVLKIRSIDAGDGWVRVNWDMPDRKDPNTVFYDFNATRTRMAQHANDSGDMGPRYNYKRC